MFQQTNRSPRALLIPALIVAVVIAGIVFAIWKFTPKSTAEITITSVSVMPSRIEYANDPGSIKVLGRENAKEDILYVAANVHIHNSLKIPIFLKDYTASLIGPDDAEYPASAVEKTDLPTVITYVQHVSSVGKNFEMPHPLLREITIPPQSDADGTLLFGFQHATEETWQKRKSAQISTSFYKQSPINIDFPATH